MSFFKDFKDDLLHAVNELVPGEEISENKEAAQSKQTVNTLEQEMDVKSELKKLEGIFEKADEPEVKEMVKGTAAKEAIQKETASKETEKKAEKVQEIVNQETMQEEKVVNTEVTKAVPQELSDEISDEVTIITEGTSITGNMETTGSFELRGRIDGNVHCNGKMTVTGRVKGNSSASEFFADAAKVEGEITTTGTVKIGLGSVVIGNIVASSAVIAGAINGDIDVQGPVVVDTSAVVMGNIKSRSVQINNGAIIEGFCSQCYSDVDVKTLFVE